MAYSGPPSHNRLSSVAIIRRGLREHNKQTPPNAKDTKTSDVSEEEPEITCSHGSFSVLLLQEGEFFSKNETYEDNSKAEILSSGFLPRKTLRWLRRRVSPGLVRSLEDSLFDKLAQLTCKEDFAVVQMDYNPNPFHRAIFHAICQWWKLKSWTPRDNTTELCSRGISVRVPCKDYSQIHSMEKDLMYLWQSL